MKITYMYGGLIVLLVVGLVVMRQYSNKKVTPLPETPYDVFAQCLTDVCSNFYGAYWCPHCQNQKKLFHDSPKLPYIECSTPNGQGQTKICADAGISSYPTWVFADGTTGDGEQTFEQLSAKTNCPVPQLP